ncbi:hypothetical protein [Pseudomonas phage vB_PaeP_4029]|nr:holin [Pseudomonas phage Pa2]YP_009286268.1 holin [Pseudomonas phage PEV2]YP_009290582.1 holin [Pseudomonas phage vB_PaeP_MAG4]AIZ94797.2 hypothetical protein [Pseudomonas phage RWG]AIZ94980.1 hypothetical protein [Pseudomonas phage phi176]ASZ72096.1 hypothetical protein vBPaePPYO2_00047 [Pseudomonas phage vB_PaeP_PYO2]ASZ72254.1 hypothetical protein vBPaePDEV_00047 [Pseudomonas phage vB_PaeP_DEV]QHZ59482.1 hypothetical protein [Pseudomonas phage LY218]UNY40753.1 hypothetical protein [Ps
MPWKSDPNIWGVLSAIALSVLSGVISLTSRIAKGHPPKFVWIVSELSSAILVGYLIYDVYPVIQHLLYEWMTMPICIAVGGHLGGRVFQWVEFKYKEKFGIPDSY